MLYCSSSVIKPHYICNITSTSPPITALWSLPASSEKRNLKILIMFVFGRCPAAKMLFTLHYRLTRLPTLFAWSPILSFYAFAKPDTRNISQSVPFCRMWGESIWDPAIYHYFAFSRHPTPVPFWTSQTLAVQMCFSMKAWLVRPILHWECYHYCR